MQWNEMETKQNRIPKWIIEIEQRMFLMKFLKFQNVLFLSLFFFLIVSLYIAEIRNEYSNQLERERELREHVEKQLNEEQKIRGKF